jgi:hypothetical protein
MTNYFTVLESEIQSTANRVWRLEQACTDEYAELHELTEDDRRIMRKRLEATKALYRVLVEQASCFHDEEEGLKFDPAKWDLDTAVDVENSPSLYSDAITDGEIDDSLLDIMDPLSFMKVRKRG